MSLLWGGGSQVARLGTEAHPGQRQKGPDWDLRLKDGGVVLAAGGEVPVPACHPLVMCLGRLGKACFLTYCLPRAYHAGTALGTSGSTGEQNKPGSCAPGAGGVLCAVSSCGCEAPVKSHALRLAQTGWSVNVPFPRQNPLGVALTGGSLAPACTRPQGRVSHHLPGKPVSSHFL